jgi:hypothetical protein
MDVFSKTLRAGDLVLALTCRALMGVPDWTDWFAWRELIAYAWDIVIRAATKAGRGHRLPGDGLPCLE